jgi:hypothetical protein
MDGDEDEGTRRPDPSARFQAAIAPNHEPEDPSLKPLDDMWASCLRRDNAVIKLASPARIVRDYGYFAKNRRRREAEYADLCGYGESPEEHDDEWMSSTAEVEKHILHEAHLYTSNNKSIQGIYVPNFYGLWTVELADGIVYMMVLEQTSTSCGWSYHTGSSESYRVMAN